ncbi:hypothetical protein TRVL_04333 [Trypanosoma vivax]|nr:hypothetical protein TRVL_04333 [Trypanosoma vivax]
MNSNKRSRNGTGMSAMGALMLLPKTFYSTKNESAFPVVLHFPYLFLLYHQLIFSPFRIALLHAECTLQVQGVAVAEQVRGGRITLRIFPKYCTSSQLVKWPTNCIYGL